MATKVGSGYVDIIGNFAPLNRQLTSSSLRSRFASIAKIGTLAGAAIGVAAIKSADEFEHSMSLISTQAGASRKEVKKLSDQVLHLSGRTTFAPNELAQALFRVESAGFRGEKAMRVLAASTKLATVGDSDLEGTTYAVVAAQKTQIKGTQNLHREIGLLNAIVGQGNLRMDDLTSALSTGILPTAKAFGLTLTDVGAALDVMTSRGIPATAAATRLRMTISLLGAQTPQATDALKTIGIAAGDLGETLTRKGLLAAVQMLADHLKNAGDTAQQAAVITQAFGGGRTSSGILTLTQSVDDLRSKYEGIDKAAGDFNEKLREAKMDPENRIRRAGAEIQTILVEIGSHLLPGVTSALADVTDLFTDPHKGLGEKFSEFADMISNAIAETAPKVVGAALVIGADVAKGIVTGFLHADILGKAAIATAIIALFGGRAAFAAIGAAIAGPIVASLDASLGAALFRAPTSSLLFRAATGLSGALATGMKFALPAAIAGIGLADIITSAAHKDFKDAGFELGGALIGGIAGFFAADGPIGALIGGGIGEQLGGLLGGLFDSSKEVKNMQERLKASAHDVAKAFKAEHESAKTLASSSDKVKSAQHRQWQAANQVKLAELGLEKARDKYPANSRQVIDAEIRVAHAKDRDRKATHDLKDAEHVHGVALHIEKQRLEDLIQSEGFQVNQLKSAKQHILDAIHNDRQRGATWDEIATKFGPKLDDVQKRLDKSQGQLNKSVATAAKEISPAYAKELRGQATALGGVSGKILKTQGSQAKYNSTLQKGQPILKATGTGIFHNVITPIDKHREAVQKTTPVVKEGTDKWAGAYMNWARLVFSGETNIVGNTKKVATGFQAKFPAISLVEPKRKQLGGALTAAQMGMDIPGRGAGDKVLFQAMTEPGEKAFILNRNASGALRYLDALNSQIPRRATGGLVFPFDAGQYAWSRTDMGVDFTGTGAIRAMGPARIIGVGAPGWPESGGVQYHILGNYGLLSPDIYVNEGVAATVSPGATVRAGQQIARFQGSSIEQGFATSTGAALAAPHYSEGDVTAEGQAMANVLHALESGGKFGAQAMQVAREIVKGEGPLADTAQAILDFSRQGANEWLAAHSAVSFGGTVGAPVTGAIKPGQTISGKVSYFGEGPGAYGYGPVPGVALNPWPPTGWNDPRITSLAGRMWDIDIQGHTARLPLIDKGPAIDERVIDVGTQALSHFSPPFTPSSFVTDAMGSATLLPQGKQMGGLLRGMQVGGELNKATDRHRRRHGQFWRNLHYFRRPPLSLTTGLPHPEPITGPGGINPRRFNINYMMRTMGTGRIPGATWAAYAHNYGSMKNRISQFTDWTRKAATWDDYATTAQALDITDPVSGEVTPGTYAGGNYPQWLNVELQGVFTLRNLLVRSIPIVEHHQKYLNKLYEQGQKAKEAVNKAMHDLDIIQKHLKARYENVRKTLNQLEAMKNPTKGQKARIKTLSHTFKLLYYTWGHNNERLARFNRQKKGLQLVLPAINDRATALGTLRQSLFDGGDTYTGLSELQGLGRSLKPMQKLPGIGTLGGSILNLQLEMRDVTGSDAGSTTGGDLSATGDGGVAAQALADVTAQLAAATQARTTVAEAQLPVFEQLARELQGSPFAGIYHTGGVVAGPYGSEQTIRALAGERVLGLADSSASAGDVRVVINGHVHTSGSVEDAIKVYVDGKERRDAAISRLSLAGS